MNDSFLGHLFLQGDEYANGVKNVLSGVDTININCLPRYSTTLAVSHQLVSCTTSAAAATSTETSLPPLAPRPIIIIYHFHFLVIALGDSLPLQLRSVRSERVGYALGAFGGGEGGGAW